MTRVEQYNGIPFLYTRGTHYEVGLDIGRTFKAMIRSYIQRHQELQNTYLPMYDTKKGRRVYEDTLATCRCQFPQYVRELEGTAEGAGVEFHKLFLMQLDEILPRSLDRNKPRNEPVNCTSICINEPNAQLLGHTEDALQEVRNHFYFVSAHITEDTPQGRYGVSEERFTSLCYAGNLPGYTMSYNHHGLVFTINTLSASLLQGGKTPRDFITRALLSAANFPEAEAIMKDIGVGAADGVSVNMTFVTPIGIGNGKSVFYNAEIAAALDGDCESQLDIVSARRHEHLIHVNKYQRMMAIEQNNEAMLNYSNARLELFSRMPPPKDHRDLVRMLGDTSNADWPVYHDTDEDMLVTLAVGIFDCIAKTWSIYSANPRDSEPLLVIPMVFKW